MAEDPQATDQQVTDVGPADQFVAQQYGNKPSPENFYVPSWDQVKEKFETAYPGVDHTETKKQWESLGKMHEARLNAAKEMPEDTPTDYVSRNLGHFTSTLGGHTLSTRARQRIAEGRAEDSDYDIVARHERLGELAAKTESTFWGGLGATILRAPEQIAMAMLAPGVGPEASLGTKALVGGATAPLNPSMWAPEAVQRAERQGGNLLAPQNVLPALGSATIQNAIFAGAGNFKQGIENPVRAWANQAGASVLAQQGGDAMVSALDAVLPEAYKTETKFGALGSFLRGDLGEGMKQLASQAIQHGAFAMLHHGDKKKAIEDVKEAAKVIEKGQAEGQPYEKIASQLQEMIGAKQKEAAAKPPEAAPAPREATTKAAHDVFEKHFGESIGGEGEFVAPFGEKYIVEAKLRTTQHGPVADISFAHADKGRELSEAPPEAETTAFGKKLLDAAKDLHKQGVGIFYETEPKRAATYGRFLKRMGFEKAGSEVTTDPKGEAVHRETWMPTAEASKRAGVKAPPAAEAAPSPEEVGGAVSEKLEEIKRRRAGKKESTLAAEPFEGAAESVRPENLPAGVGAAHGTAEAEAPGRPGEEGAAAPGRVPPSAPGAGEGGGPGAVPQGPAAELTGPELPAGPRLPPEVEENISNGLTPEEAERVHDVDARKSGGATLAERMKAKGRAAAGQPKAAAPLSQRRPEAPEAPPVPQSFRDRLYDLGVIKRASEGKEVQPTAKDQALFEQWTKEEIAADERDPWKMGPEPTSEQLAKAETEVQQYLKDIPNDIEEHVNDKSSGRSKASLRREAEKHVLEGFQAGAAHADERASGQAPEGGAEAAPAPTVPGAAGNELNRVAPDQANVSINGYKANPQTMEALHRLIGGREIKYDQLLAEAVKAGILLPGRVSNARDTLTSALTQLDLEGKIQTFGPAADRGLGETIRPAPGAAGNVGEGERFLKGPPADGGKPVDEAAHDQYRKALAGSGDQPVGTIRGLLEGNESTAAKELIKKAGDVPVFVSDGLPADVPARHILTQDGQSFIALNRQRPLTAKELAWALGHEGAHAARARTGRGVAYEPGKPEEEHAFEESANRLAEAISGRKAGERSLAGPPAGAAGNVVTGQSAAAEVTKSPALGQAVKDFLSGEAGSVTLDEAYEKLGVALNYTRNAILKLGGDSFPATHQIDREAGEFMTRSSVARDHGARKGQYHADHVLGKDATDTQAELVGAVAGETRLRYARRNVASEVFKAGQQIVAAQQRANNPNNTPAQKKQAQKEAKEAAGRAKELRNWLKGSHDSLINNPAFPDFPIKSDAEYQKALQDPYVKGVLDKYRKDVGPEMDRNYASAIGMDVSQLQTLTQIPGMPLNFTNLREEGRPISEGANLKKLREQTDPFARAAKLGGKDYDFNFRNMIENSFQAGEVAAKQAELNRALIERGLAEPASRGDRQEGATFVPDVHHRIPLEDILKAKQTMTPKDFRNYLLEAKKQDGLNVRDDIVDEYLRAKGVETPAEWKKWSKKINQIPLLGSLASSVEGLAHIKNQLIANFAPGMSIVDTIKNTAAAFKGNKAFEKEMLELSNIGATKTFGEHKGVLEQLPIVGQALEQAKQYTGGYSLDPTYYMGQFIKKTDEVMRVSLKHAYENAVPKDQQTEQGLRDFVNHWQFNYNKKALPQIIAFAKDTGLGPFAVASSQGKLRNISMLAGGHGIGGLGAQTDLRLRAEVFRNILTPIVAGAITNYFTTGRMDGGEDAPPLSVYVGTDENGKKKYLDIGTLTGVSPALRSIGLMAQIEGARTGQAVGSRIDKSAMDIAHSIADPFLGPGVRTATIGLTGHDVYGKKLAKEPGPEGSAIKENLKAAAGHINPLAATLMEKDKTVGEKVAQAAGPFGLRYTEGKHPSVRNFYEAYRKTIDQYKEDRFEQGKLGQKIRQPPELAMMEQFGQKIHRLDLAYNQPSATPEQKKRYRADQAAIAKSALEKLEFYQKAKR